MNRSPSSERAAEARGLGPGRRHTPFDRRRGDCRVLVHVVRPNGTRRRRHGVRPRHRSDADRRHPPREPGGEGDGAEHQDTGGQGARSGAVEGRADHGTRGVDSVPPRLRPRSGSLPADRTELRRGAAAADVPIGDARDHCGEHRGIAVLGCARIDRAPDSGGRGAAGHPARHRR